MVVRQVGPGLAVRAVVLADGPPLPLAGVRPPLVPGAGLAQPVLQPPEPGDALALRGHATSPSRPGPAGARPAAIIGAGLAGLAPPGRVSAARRAPTRTRSPRPGCGPAARACQARGSRAS